MNTEAIKYYFYYKNADNKGEIINNVAANTFNNYCIDKLGYINIVCKKYKVHIDFKLLLNTLFMVSDYNKDGLYYSRKIISIDEFVSLIINNKISLSLALRQITSIMKELIKCFELNIIHLHNAIDNCNCLLPTEYEVHFINGDIILSTDFDPFSYEECKLDSIKKIIFIKNKCICVYENNTLSFKHNNIEQTIQFSNITSIYKTLFAFIPVIEAIINA